MTDRQLLEPSALAAFCVFAESLSLTRAAEELHITQPSLHAKLKKLSIGLGQPLYRRAGRELVLTEAGEELAAFGREQRRRTDDFLDGFGQPSQRVRLAAGRGALLWVLGAAIRNAITQGVDVRILPESRARIRERLADGSADVGAFAGAPPPSELASRKLATYPQVMLVPSDDPVTSRARVPITSLEGRRLIAPPPQGPQRQALDEAISTAGVSVDVVAEADGWDLTIRLASLGVGCAIVNGCVEPPDGLIAIPVIDLPKVTYWLAWRPERRTAARLMIKAVTDGS